MSAEHCDSCYCIYFFLRVNVRRDEDLIPELNMNYDSQCDIMFFLLLFYAFTSYLTCIVFYSPLGLFYHV